MDLTSYDYIDTCPHTWHTIEIKEKKRAEININFLKYWTSHQIKTIKN